MSERSRARAVQKALALPYQRALQLVRKYEDETKELARFQSLPLSEASVKVVAEKLAFQSKEKSEP